MSVDLINKIKGAKFYAEWECSSLLNTMAWKVYDVQLGKRFEEHYNNYINLTNWLSNLEKGTSLPVCKVFQDTMFNDTSLDGLRSYENED